MTDKEASAKTTGPEVVEAMAELASIKRILVFVILACLGGSVAFNIYLVHENEAVRVSNAELAQRMRFYTNMHRAFQSVIMDLRGLSPSEKSAQGLLEKYGRVLRDLNLLSPHKGPPEPR